jgi:GNAT superfamily N-acetyltransferase
VNKAELTGYIPGAIGRIAELHGKYYHEHWGFGLFFESRVAIDLSEFLRRFDEERDGFWVASVDKEIIGSIAIDGIHHGTEGAHLRWFIVAPENQGQATGSMLMREAMEFCRRKRFHRIYLETFAGLDVARHLYEKWGFTLSEEREGSQWGKKITEQKFEAITGSHGFKEKNL